MTAVVLSSAAERHHLHRALERHVHLHGRDGVPDALVNLLDALSRQITPQGANLHPGLDNRPDAGLMSYTEAAERLAVSKRTVSRLVRDGRLIAVGRRLTARSVDTALRGDSWR